MALEIRTATAADIPELVALMAAFYAESNFPLPPSSATRAFEALLAQPHLGAVWLAEYDGAVVAHVVLTIGFGMEYGGLRGVVDDLYVRPMMRGRGVGGRLLTAVRAAATEQGV
jgi:predicted N-acetyltransferase YhbS